MPALRRLPEIGRSPAFPNLTVPVLTALAVCWTAVYGYLSIAQHEAFLSHAYDLAIYDQVVWNTSQGRLFENSVMHFLPHFLGDHFSLALMALVPLYWIYPDPKTLLLVQAVALGLTALPVGILARKQIGSDFAGV